MRSRFFRLATAGVCLLLVAAAAACGEGEQEPLPPISTPLPPSTPEVLPTVDPGVPLVEYRLPDRGCSLGYPEGWEELEEQSGPDLAVFSWALDGKPMAQLTILCNEEENQTLDSLIQQDAAIISGLGGAGFSEPTPIEVAGTAGKQVTYTINFAGFAVEQVAAYVVKGECGWRIGLATYGEGSLRSYLPLFERIIASFRLD